jgi:hypothetical protein
MPRNCGIALTIGAGSVVCCIASLLRFAPRVWFGNYTRYSMATTEGTRAPLLLAQLRNPVHWDRLDWLGTNQVDSVLANGNALRWRLLPPVVGRLLYLPPTLYLALPWAGVAALLGLVALYGYRETRDVTSAVALVSLATTSAPYFVGTGWLSFDPFYVVGLVAFCLSPSTAVMLAACALAPWLDERFLLMLPACACARWALYPDRRRQLWAVAAILPYVAARLAALAMGDTSVATQVRFQTVGLADELRYCATYLPLGLFEGFRAGWPVLFAGAALLWSRCAGRAERLALGAAALAGLGATFFLAWDSSRSSAVFLPLLVLGCNVVWARRALPWLALANLALPAAHVYGDAFVPLHSVLSR